MQLPRIVYHELCRQWHKLIHARELVAVGVGMIYVGWVRCAGATLHVYYVP